MPRLEKRDKYRTRPAKPRGHAEKGRWREERDTERNRVKGERDTQREKGRERVAMPLIRASGRRRPTSQKIVRLGPHTSSGFTHVMKFHLSVCAAMCASTNAPTGFPDAQHGSGQSTHALEHTHSLTHSLTHTHTHTRTPDTSCISSFVPVFTCNSSVAYRVQPLPGAVCACSHAPMTQLGGTRRDV
jgi:hypothetical protein